MACAHSRVAASFGATGVDPAGLGRTLDGVATELGSVSGMLLFASGRAADEPERVLGEVKSAVGNIPAVLAVGAGVRSEQAEHESVPALSGLAWRLGQVALAIDPDADDASAVVGALRGPLAASPSPNAVFVFGTSDALGGRAVAEIGGAARGVPVVGAGCLPQGVVCLTAKGTIERAKAAGMLLSGIAAPLVTGASPCRLVGPLLPVTATQGAFVLTIGGRPALEVLSAGGRALKGQPLVLAIATDPGDGDEKQTMLVRGIRGIDPTRGAVLVSDEIAPGMLLSFGALDAAAARLELERALRDSARKLAGGAPQFGLLFTCATRGSSFYGAPNVEIGLVRDRFRGLPFAGMLSPFEIAPFGTTTAVHLHTAVVALFAAPS
jgi:small ligand-binding sensory domain FIST